MASLGWINYWNLWPLRLELRKILGARTEFRDGHPAQINKWLVEGSIQMAPASSICLLKHNQLNFALPVGVASTGPVMSVYLGFPAAQRDVYNLWQDRIATLKETFSSVMAGRDFDPRQIARSVAASVAAGQSPGLLSASGPIKLTSASAASAAMTRTLHRLLFGPDAKGLDVRSADSQSTDIDAEPSIDLLIGDEALRCRNQYDRVLDLGEVWNRITGLPFVFAVWQLGAGTDAFEAAGLRPVMNAVKEAAELAQAKMRVAAADYRAALLDSPFGAGAENVDLARYWKLIEYVLTPQHLRGLMLYLCLARATGAVRPDNDELALGRLMRWQQQAADASGVINSLY
ncbi:MAG: putative futalosine synthase [Pseudomonadota bacterium]|jgi:predicted solute-binding protein